MIKSFNYTLFKMPKGQQTFPKYEMHKFILPKFEL